MSSLWFQWPILSIVWASMVDMGGASLLYSQGFPFVNEFVPFKFQAGCIFRGVHCPFSPRGLLALTHSTPRTLEEPCNRISPFKAMDAILGRQAALLCFSQLAPGWGISDFKNYPNLQLWKPLKSALGTARTHHPTSVPSSLNIPLPYWLSSWYFVLLYSLFLHTWEEMYACLPGSPFLERCTASNHTTVTRQAVSCSLHPSVPGCRMLSLPWGLEGRLWYSLLNTHSTQGL